MVNESIQALSVRQPDLDERPRLVNKDWPMVGGFHRRPNRGPSRTVRDIAKEHGPPLPSRPAPPAPFHHGVGPCVTVHAHSRFGSVKQKIPLEAQGPDRFFA